MQTRRYGPKSFIDRQIDMRTAPGLVPGVQRLLRYFQFHRSSSAKAVEPLGQAQGRCKVFRPQNEECGTGFETRVIDNANGVGWDKRRFSARAHQQISKIELAPARKPLQQLT